MHRRRTSAVKLRTRAVSASERATLFESPVPDGISRVVEYGLHPTDGQPVEHNRAVHGWCHIPRTIAAASVVSLADPAEDAHSGTARPTTPGRPRSALQVRS